MHVLFVCWGNICRSPAAEATFRKLLEERGLDKAVTCDSAGTMGQHHGDPPDSRMRRAAKDRGVLIGGSARMVTNDDFERADLLLTMDDFNFSELGSLAPSDELRAKIKPFCSYVSSQDKEVPDPYYGGPSGFEKVLDLLEDGCDRLLGELEQGLAPAT